MWVEVCLGAAGQFSAQALALASCFSCSKLRQRPHLSALGALPHHCGPQKFSRNPWSDDDAANSAQVRRVLMSVLDGSTQLAAASAAGPELQPCRPPNSCRW